MPSKPGLAPFQCCTPDIREVAGVLYLGAQNGTWLWGARIVRRVDVAANYTMDDSADYIVGVDSTGGAYTITLPTAVEGKIVIVKDLGNAGANNVTVDPAGAATIDGAPNVAIAANYGVVRAYCDSTDWFTW